MTPYHHGDLRAQILVAAESRIRAAGPGAVSLRELARDAGVSHAAPAHHFGSRRGLLTALAAQGHRLLGQALAEAAPRGFAALGVAYVEFAVGHPAHFTVMFDPSLVDVHDPDLAGARALTLGQLSGGARSTGTDSVGTVALAGWAMVHGIAVLHLSGSLDAAGVRAAVGDGGVLDLTRQVTSRLRTGADH